LPYALAVVAVTALIQLRVISALLRARGRFGAMNAVDVATPALLLAGFGGTALLWGLTVQGAVWIWSLVFLAPLAMGYAFAGRKAWPRALASRALVLRVVRFGAQNQLTGLVQLLNYRIDTFLILVLVNTTGVGLYTVATSQTEGLWILADSVVIVLLTNITAGDEANAVRMTPVVCRNTMLVTGVAAVVAALIAGLWIPVVFGRDYQGSVAPYLWLLPGTVAFSGTKVLAAYVLSRGRPILNAWIAIGTFAVSVPATSLLTYSFGVPGAAAGTSLGYGVSLALSLAVYRALSGSPVREAVLPVRDDISIYTRAVANLWRRVRRKPSAALREPTGAD
jgi:O-antigen/teichoic acid export membrane protein